MGVVGRRRPWWWSWVVVWGSSLLVACAGRVVVPRCCRVVLCRCCRVVAVLPCCCCRVVVVMCCCPVYQQGRLRGEGRQYLLGCPRINNERRTMVIVRRLVATSLTATWHLDCVSTKERREGRTDSPGVDGDDVVRLHRRCREGEGQRVVMGREEEVWEKIG